MYEIVFSDRAVKALRKLDRQMQERIIAALERIRIRPETYVTKLIGDSGYKLRVGAYRLILDIYHGKLLILVLTGGHRRNVYNH